MAAIFDVNLTTVWTTDKQQSAAAEHCVNAMLAYQKKMYNRGRSAKICALKR